MSTYSIEGYSVALKLRSAKTILVEGLSDKRILARLILQHDIRLGRKTNFVIDEVALVSSDSSLTRKGSKEKVELIAAALQNLSTKMNWLVDREWEGVDLDSDPVRLGTQLQSPWGARTKGHSIENYWFRDQFISNYLKMFFGHHLNAEFFRLLSVRFDMIIRLAAAYSFASKRQGTISRSTGLIKAANVEWDGTRYIVLDSLSVALRERGFDGDIAVEIMSELDRNSLRSASVAVLQWLCHGHLGEETIRACAAHLARSFGCSNDIIEAIERGDRAEKVAHHADGLAQLEIEHIEPLGDLISWLGGPTS